MAYDNRYLRGVGGWLALFVIILAVLTPIRVLLEMFRLHADVGLEAVFGPRMPVLLAAEWLLAVTRIGVCWYVAWRLNSVHVWQSVRIAIAAIWSLSLGLNLVEIAAVSLIGALPLSQVAPGAMLGTAQGLIFSAIWTAYLLRSERVANTYEKAADLDDPAEVFS